MPLTKKKAVLLTTLLSFFILILIQTHGSGEKNKSPLKIQAQIPASIPGQIDPEEYFNVPLGITLKDSFAYVTDLGHARIVQLSLPTLQYVKEIPILDPSGKRNFFLLGRPAFDQKGSLWVSDMENARILKIDPENGKILHQFGKKGEKPGEFHSPNGLAFDEQGFLWVADELNSRIQKCDVKNGKCQAFPMGNPGFPQDLAFYQGFLYVCVTWENKVVKLNPQTMTPVQEFQGGLNHPRGLAVDKNGLIYVADNENQRTVIFSPDGSVYRSITSLKYNRPAGIKVSDDGAFYQVMAQSHFVLRFDASFQETAQAGKTRNLPFQLFMPMGVSDNGNTLAICDMMNHRVQFYNPEGVYLKSSGPVLFPSSAIYAPDGTLHISAMAYDASQAKYFGAIYSFNSQGNLIHAMVFNQPQDSFVPARLDMDTEGNLYASDYYQAKLFKINPSSFTVTARYQSPGSLLAGLAVHPSKNLVYVADSAKNLILKFNKDLVYQGSLGTPGSDQGEFFGIADVTLDQDGNLWVADSGNFRLQAFSPQEKWILSFGDIGLTPDYFFGLTTLRSQNSSRIFSVSLYLNQIRSYEIQKLKSQESSHKKFHSRKNHEEWINKRSKTAADLKKFMETKHDQDSLNTRFELMRLLNRFHE